MKTIRIAGFLLFVLCVFCRTGFGVEDAVRTTSFETTAIPANTAGISVNLFFPAAQPEGQSYHPSPVPVVLLLKYSGGSYLADLYGPARFANSDYPLYILSDGYRICSQEIPDLIYPFHYHW